MPVALPRTLRSFAVLMAGALVVGSAATSSSAANAMTRSGDVNVTIPSTIVIDGGSIPIKATTSAYLYDVSVALTVGSEYSAFATVKPNADATVSTLLMKPGTTVAKGYSATSYCSTSSTDPCHYSSDRGVYEFVYGLTMKESDPAIAKYGSKVSLSGTNDGTATTWTAGVQQYGGLSWKEWAGATVTIGSTTVTTDAKGVATWVEPTSELRTSVATVSETDSVWSSASAATTPTRVLASKPIALTPLPAPKPDRVTTSASATKAATALKKRVPTVRKVVTLTKKNDGNKLLGRSNGYTSAAVLYDRRLACSGGPGVGCGATIEKFTSTSKAKARAKHVQKLLKRYPFLGTEHDTVHGRFLLRVSGDLTRSQAAKYKSGFVKSFK